MPRQAVADAPGDRRARPDLGAVEVDPDGGAVVGARQHVPGAVPHRVRNRRRRRGRRAVPDVEPGLQVRVRRPARVQRIGGIAATARRALADDALDGRRSAVAPDPGHDGHVRRLELWRVAGVEVAVLVRERIGPAEAAVAGEGEARPDRVGRVPVPRGVRLRRVPGRVEVPLPPQRLGRRGRRREGQAADHGASDRDRRRRGANGAPGARLRPQSARPSRVRDGHRCLPCGTHRVVPRGDCSPDQVRSTSVGGARSATSSAPRRARGSIRRSVEIERVADRLREHSLLVVEQQADARAKRVVGVGARRGQDRGIALGSQSPAFALERPPDPDARSSVGNRDGFRTRWRRRESNPGPRPRDRWLLRA